jgi:hypothetical protein
METKPSGWVVPFLFSSDQRDRLLDQILARNVFVEDNLNCSSGVRINDSEVLTTSHDIVGDPWIKVDGKLAEVIQRDRPSDLLLLRSKAKTPIAPVTFRSKVERLDPAVSVGYREHKALGRRKTLRVFTDLQTVMAVYPDRVYMSNRTVDCFSGGGLYLLTGELIGIIQETEGDVETGRIPNAIAVPMIKPFLVEAKSLATTSTNSQLGLI